MYDFCPQRKTLELIKRVKELFDPFQDPDVDRVLELDLLCVHTDYCRRGIAGKMVEVSGGAAVVMLLREGWSER